SSATRSSSTSCSSSGTPPGRPPLPLVPGPRRGARAGSRRGAGAGAAGAAGPFRRRERDGAAAAAAALSLATRLGDERLEERAVLARLRVPEDADREAPLGILERLDRAVVRPRGRPQPVADPPQPLVVVRLDRRPLAEQLAEP